MQRALMLCVLSAALSLPAMAAPVDLSGTWDIHEEERSYIATLDQKGNGSYNWQNGSITTTAFLDGRWQGTWQQPGNDREGGFEILLSQDRTKAEGKWWYTRVGQQIIPPGEWGGNFTWTRQAPPPSITQ